MSVLCVWKIFFMSFWFQAFLAGIHCRNGNPCVSQLSKEDILVMKDEESPKCFSRTGEDFTCFFETMDNKTFDLFYKHSAVPRTRCKMSVCGTEEGTFLHICSFPRTDVYLYTDTEIQVMESTNNTMFYNRTVTVENHYLLKPPFKVSVKPNGHEGQLDVSWDAEVIEYMEDEEEYRIRYSSRSLGETTTQTKKKSIQLPLVPGEEVEVQVGVKLAFSSDTGHWSSWSQPVRASVPQSADELSLRCTFDLQSVTCHWNGTKYGANNEYKLFYKMSSRESLQWTEWTECLAGGKLTDTCYFYGDTAKKIKIKLSSTSDSINRTFFSEEFTLRNLIKTVPPRHLKGEPRKDKLCLEWDAPVLSLSNHLQYEVNVQIRGGERWSIIKGPDTNTCVKVPSGSQFSVKIRAKPTGSIYSGYWSNWSDVLTDETPADTDLLLLWCILVPMLIIAISFICVSCLYRSRLEQYFWPPVPNLEKVLQNFLTDINQQKWGPPVITKQCFEETPSSVVEIMTEDEIPGLEKSSEETSELLTSDGSLSTVVQVNRSPGTEVLSDYVTLNRELAFICVGQNSYVYEQVTEKEDPEVGDSLLQTCPFSCTEGVRLCSGNNYFNQSYLTMSKSAETLNSKISAETAPGNHYTNFPYN
ncbi:thrombopoietin receptor [Kryptolebias marmoratus]|uniref:thrombopoietin receptor n=1 Tax=Kryptolebias marmoratus TaxID=37003 RepID=UPI0007F8BF4D|nr:thrombopoietin receptor [Kryptolebias marmoratus]